MKKLFFLILLCLGVTIVLGQTANEYFSPVKYRSIGPFRGGRSVCGSGVPGDNLTYYMGTTGGGLWKTSDAGQRWENVSDGFFKTGSVGSVAVASSSPNTVYVGMGEHAPRGVMTSYGDGVYKSTDAGKTWNYIGLNETQQIARITIHPANADVVYVAAQGALHGSNKERGVYKSIDGGKSWKQVLFVNESTGCSELSIDQNAPNIVYATMWEHERKPWKVISGGAGSGVYKSVDGGETWKKIEEGLPKEKGKMAISVSPANSDKVYLLMESDTNKDQGGLYVSNDGGDNWTLVNDENRLTQRSWYYIEVFTDPNNENLVYVMSAPALKSIDGGKTFFRITGTHGDFHDLWINPDNSKNLLISNDGGSAISFNGGKTWSTQSNMPTAQFYRVTADNLFPYNLYGGQQDNSSVRIASMNFGWGGIDKENWTDSAGGESAFLAFDPDNPRYVMGGSYLGYINVKDMESDVSTMVMAAPHQYLGRAAKDMEYLFNWNAPIIRSQHEENTFFHAAQLVLRTNDMGMNWEEMSPDLTRNIDEKQGNGGGPYTNEAVGAENYGTISYLVESPHEAGVFWTGSDDGLVHITRNNGTSWVNVTPKDLQECLVNAIDISPHDPSVAYLATTRYKFNDKAPELYKTTDYGKSWKNISRNIPNGAYTRVVREDKDRKGLLYAGTETGVYISWNDGGSWESLQLNLPVTPINDLMVHKGDLLIATSGRSFWILDDLGLLGQYESTGTTKIYQPESLVYGAWSSPLNDNSKSFNGTNTFNGVNPASGVVLYYELSEKPEGEISLEITDTSGKTIRTISSEKQKEFKKYAGAPPSDPTISKKKGLNRFVWNTRHPTIPGIPTAYLEANYRGHKVLPGEYTFKLKVGNESYKTTGKILENPLYDIPSNQLTDFDEFMTIAEANITEMHNMVNQLKAIQEQIVGLVSALEDGDLKEEGKELIDVLKKWDEDMVQRKSKAYDDVENFPNKFTAEYLFMINACDGSLPRVNQAARDRKKVLDAQWEELKKQADRWRSNEIPAFNKKLWEAGIGAIKIK